MWIVRLLECEQQQERSCFSENDCTVYDVFHNVLLLNFLEVYIKKAEIANVGRFGSVKFQCGCPAAHKL